jgi:hypothetical protein
MRLTMFEQEPHHDVERDLARRELRDRLVRRVVGRDLDLRARRLLELLDEAGVDVVRVVVDLQRPVLDRRRLRHWLVVVRDRPGDGVVGAWERQTARADGLRLDEIGAASRFARADRRRRVLTGGQPAEDADADRTGGCACEELFAGEAGSILRMRHAAGPLNPGPDREVKPD